MAFCGKCGTKIEDGVKFCPSCGNAMVVGEQQVQQTVQKDYAAKLQNLNNTADTTAEFDKQDIEQNKIMGVFAYLSWLVLIPIFAAPKSKFARFHANQGLVLAITEIVWWIAQIILTVIIYAISYKLGFITKILGLANIAFFVMTIIGILNAINGKAKELPVIGKIRILK